MKNRLICFIINSYILTIQIIKKHYTYDNIIKWTYNKVMNKIEL